MTGPATTLADVQDVDVNYCVLVPFTTAADAEWAARRISASFVFDCHVVSSAAVDQSTPVIANARAK